MALADPWELSEAFVNNSDQGREVTKRPLPTRSAFGLLASMPSRKPPQGLVLCGRNSMLLSTTLSSHSLRDITKSAKLQGQIW